MRFGASGFALVGCASLPLLPLLVNPPTLSSAPPLTGKSKAERMSTAARPVGHLLKTDAPTNAKRRYWAWSVADGSQR